VVTICTTIFRNQNRTFFPQHAFACFVCCTHRYEIISLHPCTVKRSVSVNVHGLNWIYLLPSTQQTIGYNVFITTCFDSHESSSGYVQNLSVFSSVITSSFWRLLVGVKWWLSLHWYERKFKNIYQEMLLGNPFNISISRKFHIQHTFRFTRFCCWSFTLAVLVVIWHGIIFIKSTLYSHAP
jgi:hypothetical protein